MGRIQSTEFTRSTCWILRQPTQRPPTSPGEAVAHFLEHLDLSQAEAARALGMSANRLNEVVWPGSTIVISAPTARKATPQEHEQYGVKP